MTQRRIATTSAAEAIAQIGASIPGLPNSEQLRIARLFFPAMKEIGMSVSQALAAHRATVGANGTAPMPDGTITPVSVYGIVDNRLFWLAEGEGARIPDLPCAEEEQAYPEGIKVRGFTNIYGERYGKGQSRAYGRWSYEAAENRIHVTGPREGEEIMAVYQCADENCKRVPDDVLPMLRARVLQRLYEGSDLSKAQYYFREFRTEIKNYKRVRLSGVDYRDYIDSIAIERSKAVR